MQIQQRLFIDHTWLRNDIFNHRLTCAEKLLSHSYLTSYSAIIWIRNSEEVSTMLGLISKQSAAKWDASVNFGQSLFLIREKNKFCYVFIVNYFKDKVFIF